jgi:hypothetical protein
MNKLILLGAASLALSGCPGGGNKCDTGDESCDTDTNTGTGTGDVYINEVDGACGGGSCTWTVDSVGEMGTVELDLIETGDPTFSCGPSSTKGALECGVWSEYHNDFTLVDFDDTSETKSITLEIVASYEDQVNNVSTIFDLDAGNIANQLTVMWTITDADGNYADCVVYGDDPSYYADYCTNVW